MSLRRIDTRYGHRYTLDGEKVDGVTTLIGAGIPKPALLPWGIKSVAEYAADHLDRLVEMQPMGREAIVSALKQSPYTDRDKAAKRGTEVHALAEKLIHGDQVDVPDELAGHVESYVQFLDDWQPKPVLVEGVVGSRKWRYCGTLDMVAELLDGRRVIADIKTTRSGIYAETALQLAAYRWAEFHIDGDLEIPMTDLGIGGGLAIWVRADGYDVFEVPCGEREFKDYLHAVWVARWVGHSKELVGDPLDRPDWTEA
ncbi:MAG: hypothetical protein ACRD0W_09595 [Acidimicrobiales bacterium]